MIRSMCTDRSSGLIFFVNGQKVVEQNPCPKTLLITYLREQLNLRGTKIGCNEGGCGSCTVMISKYDRRVSSIRHEARYACMVPLCSLHGMAVTTVEALGSTRTGLHKLQEVLVKGHGVQCGFCTPGMLMSMYSLIRHKSNPSDIDIEDALRGNLCRCTGYRPIIASFKSFAKNECPMGENCCQNKNANNNNKDDDDGKVHIPDKFYDDLTKNKQELIFPSELQLSDQYDRQSLLFCSQSITWCSPVTGEEVLTMKQLFPGSIIVAGGNAMVFKLKSLPVDSPQIFISLSRISDFNVIDVNDDGVVLGPNVTIAAFEACLKNILINYPESKTRIINSMLDVCQRFGSVQIRNTATVCGGLAQGIKGSDLNILLLATNCKVTVLSRACERLMNVDIEFFSTKTRVRSSEVIIRLFIPFSDENKYYGFSKLSPRVDFSQANLNSGFSIELDGTYDRIVKETSFNFGGQFERPLTMTGLADHVKGKSWAKTLLPRCLEEIGKDFDKLKNLGFISGSQSDLDYLLFAMRGLFFKFFVKVLIKLTEIFSDVSLPDDGVLSSANFSFNHKNDLHSGMQVYNNDSCGDSKIYGKVGSPSPPANGQNGDDDLGKPLPHVWASQSTTGEAIFIDDHFNYQSELCLSIVTSTRASATILKVDYTEAINAPGVVGYIDHNSVQGSNYITIFETQELFATREVYYVGQMIGAIVARTYEQARQGCSLVRVSYEEHQPIITIENSVEKASFHRSLSGQHIRRGNPEKAFERCDGVVENEVMVGGQEHFYMETHCCRVVPLHEDGGELEVFAGSQYAASLQKVLSKTVNLPQNKINIRVKRMGGAFGGKEARTWITVAPCAVAALKYNLPVRCMLSRREDMQMTGHRRPFKAKYKAGFTMDGKIQALDLQMFANVGWFPDTCPDLMGLSLLNIDNVYSIPNVTAVGHSCKTNLPPCTPMRAAGTAQTLIIAESWMSDVADYLDRPAHEIRELNMYKPGDLTIGNCPIEKSFHRCYEEVKKLSHFDDLRQQVQEFNRKNKYVKQAVTLLSIKFSPCFSPCRNKGSAFVTIFSDGTVLMTHGGVESGQGLHTKMIQVASRTLGISASYIHISETSTSSISNTETTGGSTGSDLNGMAVMDACHQIIERLKPLKDANPSMSWEDLVNLALTNKINLSAFGYWNGAYNEDYNWETGEGRIHSYYTYGTVVSHVEVDCLTGEHVILQVDIVMDVGKSLNPAIDVGQIEGGFVMGLGFCLLEEHRYSSDGTLETIGPGKYHVPTVGNLPLKMNVTLLKDSGNEKAVYSSKGIGEPPLLLSTSVWLAIKEVVSEIRKAEWKADRGDDEDDDECKPGIFQFNTPATSKSVLLACGRKTLNC